MRSILLRLWGVLILVALALIVGLSATDSLPHTAHTTPNTQSVSHESTHRGSTDQLWVWHFDVPATPTPVTLPRYATLHTNLTNVTKTLSQYAAVQPAAPTTSTRRALGMIEISNPLHSESLTPFLHFTPPSRYFDETGHNVWGHFLDFYHTNGEVAVLGLPLTEVLETSDGTLVQYFERARLEILPHAPEQVQLAPLGLWLAEQHPNQTPFEQHPATPGRAIYIAQTGHNLPHDIHDIWQAHGGVSMLGNPISEPFVEEHHDDTPRFVQYFERGRIEASLDSHGTPMTPTLGLIGRDMADMANLDPELQAAAYPIRVLGQSGVFVGSSLTGSVQNVHIAARALDGLTVTPGSTGSFLQAIGDVTPQAGYTTGGAIIDGTVVETIGGGICYVSTIFYRAALRAGLPIVERHHHTLALREFQDLPGLDSAVFTPDMDMIWHNDTPGPIVLHSIITDDGNVSVTLWGYDDGRQTTISDPLIGYVTPPDGALWRLDETLPPGTIRQVAFGGAGMNVTVLRHVVNANDEVLRSDQIVSSYAPWHDVFVHGPGVDPACEVANAETLPRCATYDRERHRHCTDTDEDCGNRTPTPTPSPPPEPVPPTPILPTPTPIPPAIIMSPTPESPPPIDEPLVLSPTPEPLPPEHAPPPPPPLSPPPPDEVVGPMPGLEPVPAVPPPPPPPAPEEPAPPPPPPAPEEPASLPPPPAPEEPVAPPPPPPAPEEPVAPPPPPLPAPEEPVAPPPPPLPAPEEPAAPAPPPEPFPSLDSGGSLMPGGNHTTIP